MLKRGTDVIVLAAGNEPVAAKVRRDLFKKGVVEIYVSDPGKVIRFRREWVSSFDSKQFALMRNLYESEEWELLDDEWRSLGIAPYPRGRTGS